MRRLLDFLVSVIGLVVLAPLFVLIAVWVKIDSAGPVLHRAQRVGKGGKLFRVYKFRSMQAGAASAGPGITRQDDPRVTRTGRWLRKTKLDEFPQLINVARGEMSLVGPRPEAPRYVACYTPEQRNVLEFLPGITSAASLRYRDEEAMLNTPDWETRYTQVILPEKLRLDLEYMQQRSFFTDLKLIWRTVMTIFVEFA